MKNSIASIIFGVVVLLIAGSAKAETVSCTSALQKASAEWSAVGLSTPAKPTQVQVGHNGYEYTGAEILLMQHQIGLARNDCNSGNQASAVERLGVVFSKLETGN